MSSVLASPGTPTIRLLPPTNSVSSTWLMTSSWPTISFFSSVMIWSRPAFIRSASARSSGEFISIVFHGDSISTRRSLSVDCGLCQDRLIRRTRHDLRHLLVRHRVHDVVHAELVRLVRKVDRHDSRCRKTPRLAQIMVVVRDRDQPLSGSLSSKMP